MKSNKSENVTNKNITKTEVPSENTSLLKS